MSVQTCGFSVRILFTIALLAPRILRRFLDSWKICKSLSQGIDQTSAEMIQTGKHYILRSRNSPILFRKRKNYLNIVKGLLRDVLTRTLINLCAVYFGDYHC
jgi:hypothetical protein